MERDTHKDVTVFVTGVSMSGGVKNDDDRAPEVDQTQPEGEEIGNSREDD